MYLVVSLMILKLLESSGLTLWRETFETGGCVQVCLLGLLFLGVAVGWLDHCSLTCSYPLQTTCVCVCGLMEPQPHRIFVALLCPLCIFLDKTLNSPYPQVNGELFHQWKVWLSRQFYLVDPWYLIFLCSYQGHRHFLKKIFWLRLQLSFVF